MKNLTLLMTVIFLVAGSHCVPVFTQDELEEFIERDSTAFIVIQEPEAILHQIESSVFFRNRHFQKALDLMVNGEFPLANHDRLNELEEKWFEIRDLLSSFDEVSLIVHSWADDTWSIPQFSIAFAGPDESLHDVEGMLSEVEHLMDSEPDEPDFFSLVAGDALPGISIQKSGNLILLSNAPEKSKELIARLERSKDKKFKSLARNRSYMQVQKLLEKRAKSPQVRGFLAPKSFRRLITNLVAGEQVIMVDPPESIASAGFQILLQYDSETIATPDGLYQPVINWDFVLTYTQPVSGFGKLIESFEPFSEFPSLPFSITSLNAIGFDLKAKYGADQEIFESYQKHLFAPASSDGKSGGMSFKQFFSFSEFGLVGSPDDLDLPPLLDSTNGAISIYHDKNPIHWKPAMEIRKVQNRQAMEKLLANKLESENQFASESDRLVEIPNDYGLLFGRTESGIREHLARQAKSWSDSGEEVPKDFAPRKSEPLSESLMSRQYEYFLNDDWMIHCDHNSMKLFLSAAYEEPSDPQTFDLLLETTRESSGQTSFFKLAYQSHRFYNVEDKRKQNSIESVRIREKYGTGSSVQSPEAWEILMSQPDKYGLRNEIESNEDATAAIQQLIVHAYNDSFGTVVSLYSRDERKMRIFGQVYSLVDE